MVFRIYCCENFTVNREYTMFDIEYYMFRNNNNLWQSELHVLPCVEGLVRYTISQKDNFNLEQLFDADEVLVSSAGALCLIADQIDGKSVGGKATEIVSKLQNILLQNFIDQTK